MIVMVANLGVSTPVRSLPPSKGSVWSKVSLTALAKTKLQKEAASRHRRRV
jgi:hypothetical protein